MDRQLLLGIKETTYGTPPAMTASATMLVENVSFKLLDTRVKSDPAKPGVGPTASQTYGQHVEFGFEIPLVGSGIAGTAPKWGGIMKACGFTETIVATTSVTYALMTDPLAADSFSFTWRDGNLRKHIISGWRGRVGLKLTAGQRPMITFQGRGLHNVVTEAAGALVAADATFTGWLDAKPVAQNTTTFTFDAVSGLGIREFSFEASDNVKYTNVPEQQNVELRGERAFTGNFKITTPKPSVYNFETHWVSGAVKTWAMVHDSVAGRIVTVNGRSQITAPDYSRNDGQDLMSAGVELVPSTLTADDDLAIVLT